MRLRYFESSPSIATGPSLQASINSNTQKERTTRRLSIAFVLFTLLLVTICSAQQRSTTVAAATTATTSVPNLIRYSGTLNDAQGAALASATPVGVTFAIYKQQDGGAAVWQETQNVTTDSNGRYSILLGSATAAGLPSDLFSQQEQRWLGVQVQGQAEQARLLLVSVPYALKAQDAATLGGLPASAFLQSSLLEQITSGTYLGTQANGQTAGNTANSTNLVGGPPTVVNCANSATGRIPVFTQAAPPNIIICNSAIYEATPYGTGPIGILNANPVAALDVTGNVNTSMSYQIGESNVVNVGSAADDNLFLGILAGASNVSGSGTQNMFSGFQSGNSNTSGSSNIFLGYQAGHNNTTGGNNIYIGNQGPSSGTESNAIRVGSSQTAAYMAGVYGGATSSGTPLFVDSTGKLGTGGGTGLVTSFNGRTGAVVPASGDYSFSLLGGTLASAQLSGTYSNALTLSNTGNVFYGNGSNLTGVVGGMGSPTYIPVWATPDTLVNSPLYVTQGAGAQCVSPPPSPPSGCVGNNGAIDVEGTNAEGIANGYQIMGASAPMGVGGTVLSIGGPNDANLFVGINSGTMNTMGTGVNHTFLGNGAGTANTSGISDTFVGYHAGTNNTTGNYNVFVGAGAGPQNVSFSYNTFTGYRSGYISGPTSCVMSGTPANDNTFYGFETGYNNTCGSENVFLGDKAGYNNTTGAGNIYIEAQGPSSGTEMDTIRIGNSNHTTTYIAGIYGVAVNSDMPMPVYINSQGQLGTTTSSLRFKEQVRDMGDSTNDLMKLRPVTFFYKPEYANGQRTLEYGLIAEEVAKVYPELVAYDKDGQPYTVRYQYIATMLLNEVQKQYHRAEAQADLIKAQQQEIDGLKQQLQVQNATLQVQNATLEERLSRLEALAKVERAAAH